MRQLPIRAIKTAIFLAIEYYTYILPENSKDKNAKTSLCEIRSSTGSLLSTLNREHSKLV